MIIVQKPEMIAEKTPSGFSRLYLYNILTHYSVIINIKCYYCRNINNKLSCLQRSAQYFYCVFLSDELSVFRKYSAGKSASSFVLAELPDRA